MKKIAYVDHSYHKKTVSTKFISELLEKKGHIVNFFWDDSWQGGDSVDFDKVLKYDVVIMFQSYAQIEEGFYSKNHSNVTYIPMLDQFGIWKGPLFNLREFWKPFQGSKVINFSFAVHGMVMAMGIRSKLVRYYQQPIIRTISKQGLHGFLWIRRENEVSWENVRQLIGQTKFDSFHLHIPKDPNSSQITMPSDDEILEYNITISTWFDKKEDFEEVLSKANVFFTPRMEEGIGQSFLEAFARGQCVVTPNNGTMNEYIQDGFTGLFYDHENIQPLDFSKVADICDNTYKACQAGYEQWIKNQDALVDFILMPNEEAYRGRYDYFSDYIEQKTCSLRAELIKFLKVKFRNVPFLKYFYYKLKKYI